MNHNIKIHCVEDFKKVTQVAFNIFSEVHQNTDNRFYIIPGGSTPKQLFNLLSFKINDWKNTNFILSDERIIKDKQISNESMVNEELIERIDGDEKPNLIKYNRAGNQTEVENILESQSPNLTFIGLGADGHTASLFPGNSDIFNENNNVCIKVKNSWESFERISLSFSYLMKSNQIIFLVSGSDKAEALKECLLGDYNPIQFPAQVIFKNYTKNIFILCDKAAGKYIA